MLNKNYIMTYEDFVNENMFNSQPILNIISILDMSIDGFNFKISPKTDYSFRIKFTKLEERTLNMFFTTIAVGGWYVTYYYILTNNIDIKFRNKFDKNLFHDLYERYEKTITEIEFVVETRHNISINKSNINVPKYLYHIAPIRVKHKILEDGLVPRSHSKLSYHDDRIYLFKNKEEYLTLSKKLKEYDYKNVISKNKNIETEKRFDLRNENSDFYKQMLIEINTDINNLKDVLILNSDPNYINGYFTYSNIFPDNIKIVEENF